MSEPKTSATKIDTVTPGILNWHVDDDRIKTRSDAFAVTQGGTSVLIDPLPLGPEGIEQLGRVEWIVLTGSCHQRSAWRYRGHFGAKVIAPEGAEELEEQPDSWYRAGHHLPGDLVAVHTPGPDDAHYSFHHEEGEGTLFCADVLYHEKDGVAFIPDQYQSNPKRTRKSARHLLELRFGVLCFSHGAPITDDPHAVIRRTLEADRKRK